ncbi:gp58-like family protein [Gemella sp. zg-570]|uniref:gp58-like family protein n=1 Tax=Gemella sp. zg-570 TaxID=2840371 RepID=UPI001C0E0F48|nr:gp58-like family protein [Gemella sp. zg-570]QWQ39324.1 gp58-like family protein [Gemella sp. zg-570]
MKLLVNGIEHNLEFKNGRYYASFNSGQDLSRLLVSSDCIGVSSFKNIQLEQGLVATRFEAPEVRNNKREGFIAKTLDTLGNLDERLKQASLRAEERFRTFESRIDSFRSEVGSVKRSVATNFNNICLDTRTTKTGSRLAFALSEPIEEASLYTVIFDSLNPPRNRSVSVRDDALANRLTLKDYNNVLVVRFAPVAIGRREFFIDVTGSSVSLLNVRVYKGDIRDVPFVKKTEFESSVTNIIQNNEQISLTASKVDEIKSEFMPGNNIFVRKASMSNSRLKFVLSRAKRANVKYTFVADVSGISEAMQPLALSVVNLVGGEPIKVKNGQFAVSFAFSDSLAEIVFSGLPANIAFENVRIFEGDYAWFFNRHNFTTKEETKAEVSVSLKEGIRALFTTKNGKVNGVVIDGVSTKIQGDLDIQGILSAYTGIMGGFRIGDNPNGSGQWLTGKYDFDVGIASGSGQYTALWANWGSNWNTAGRYAWRVTSDGQMYCGNTASFYNGIDVTERESYFNKLVYLSGGAEITQGGYTFNFTSGGDITVSGSGRRWKVQWEEI